MKSIRDLYKVGKGPSSSHTMGPERAARIFKQENPGAERYEVTLYGSLALTGVGHGTDRVLSEVLAPTPTEIIFSKKDPGDLRHRQHISLFQCIQFLKQSFKFFTSDRRSCAVDLRSIDGFEFDVDPGKSILKLDKFGCNAHLLDFSADLLSGETGDKSKCRTLNAEIFQNDRDVDPLSTGKHLL